MLGANLGILLEVVVAAERTDVDAQLLGDAGEGVAVLYLIEVAALLTLGGCRCAVGIVGGVACQSGIVVAVLALVEYVEVAGDVLIGEVEEQLRVDGLSAETCFEMEMGTKGMPRVAAQADGLSRFHFLIGGDEMLGKVTVDGFQPVVVSHNDVVSVAAGVIACYADFSVESGNDGVAGVHFDVEPLVHTAEGGAIAIAAGDIATRRRHGEAAKVYLEAVGNHIGGVGVGLVGVPGGIEGIDGFRVFRLLEEALQGHGVYRLELAVDRGLTGYEVLPVAACRTRCKAKHAGSYSLEKS